MFLFNIHTGVSRIPCYWGASPGYGVRNNEIREKIAKKADLTVYASNPRGVCTPFASPGYAGGTEIMSSVTSM